MAMVTEPHLLDRKHMLMLAAVVVALIVVASVAFVYYSPDYSWSASIRDHDGDGHADRYDEFPDDASEWEDTDGDTYGDNCDCFPGDSSEWIDSDADGCGDNKDEFPYNPEEWLDSDRDGYGDNGDDFPYDEEEWNDEDGDGVGDNSDAFPADPTNTTGLYCGFEDEFVPPFFILYGSAHDGNDAMNHTGNCSYSTESDLEIIGVDCCGIFGDPDAISQTGRVVVWLYDPGAEMLDNATIEIDDLWGNHLLIGLLGPSETYHYRINDEYHQTDIGREAGWRKFEIVVANTESEVYIDGAKILETTVITSMHMLWIGDWWGDGVVSEGAYFDDLAITLN